ncbi:MAG: metallophosphoesterase, partial [Oscillospiraceae bacterium]|nr:metallophosphoesterase [Oscillospiraceae bacterium]
MPFRKRRRCGCGCLSLAVLVALIFALYDSNTRIITQEYELSFANLPPGFDRYRIAVVSDVHAKAFGKNNARLVAAVKGANPDIIAVTGDLIDGKNQLDIVLPLIDRLVEIAPVYFVTGNHEWDSGEVKPLFTALSERQVHVMRNALAILERGGDTITLVGLEDPNGPRDMRTPEEMFAQVSAGQFTVALVHRNSFLHRIAALGGDLILSGHAHGGIVRLPFTDGLIDHAGFFPTHTSGVYTEG